MTDFLWEVSYVTKKGKPETVASSSEDDARETLDKMKSQYAICTLTKVEVGDDGVETQVYRWRYTKGELTSENNDVYRRPNMTDLNATTQTDDTPDFEIPAVSKFTIKAERDAVRAAAKIERDAAREAMKVEREAAKAARAEARAEARARGEKLPGVPRQSKWLDGAVINFGPNYKGKNPKRVGSMAFDSFSKYVDGMTVKEYKDSGAHNPLGNIAWDRDRGFITVTQMEAAPTEEAPAEEASA